MASRQIIVQFTKTIRRWLVVLPIILVPALANADEGEAEVSWDGMVALEETESAVAYIDPYADFSVFRRVSILDPHVAFRSNWLRDQNRSRSRNIRASDVERIKNDVGELFVSVFTEQLETAGYEVVNYVDEDVLIVRPAIIDLDITAPDIRTSTRSRTYAADAGAATLVVELFDSMSGDLLGRAVDRRTARSTGGWMMSSNRVSNRSAARREFRAWADRLVGFLDAHYVDADVAE